MSQGSGAAHGEPRPTLASVIANFAIGGDAEIDLLGQQKPAGVRVAVHGRDHRLVDLEGAAQVHHEVTRRDREGGVGHLLQIAAGAEGVITGPGQHRHRRTVVDIEAFERLPDAVAGRLVQRVASFRPVQRYPGDPVPQFVGDGLLFGHRRLLVVCPHQIRSPPPGRRVIGAHSAARNAMPSVLRVSVGSISPS